MLRSLAEEHDEDIGGRPSFKAINPKFLLKYDEWGGQRWSQLPAFSQLPPYTRAVREPESMVERVLIQKTNGEFATANGWVALSGFNQKAYPIALFECPQLRDGQVEVTPDTLVAGGVATVRHALRALGSRGSVPEPSRAV